MFDYQNSILCLPLTIIPNKMQH